MACGRPKNLEIAARNPLCSPGDRRRNFLTTRDGNRRRGNPEPPGKGQLRAFGPKRSPAPQARRKLRATGAGETPGHPVLGKLWGLWSLGKPGATWQEGNPQGGTSGQWRREDFEVCGRGETPSHVRRRKLWAVGERENFRLCGGGETPRRVMRRKLLATRRRENLILLTWGNPGHLVIESPEPLVREILGATRLGETPGSLAKRKARATGAGSPPSHPVIRSTGAPGAFLALVGSRAAQRTLRNRRDGAVRLGEAPPSHTWRGLVLCLPCLVPLCPTGQNRGRTDTPPLPRPFPAAAAGLSACSAVRRRRYRRPARTGGTRPAGRPPGRTNWPAGRPR